MVVERGKGKPTYLTEAKKTALQNLGFHMRKEPSLPLAEHLWMDRLEELEIFREENGHANVPNKISTVSSSGVYIQYFMYMCWTETYAIPHT